MLRIAPALLLLLAGCTGLVDDEGSPTDADRVPIIVVVNHIGATMTFQIEVLQSDGSLAPRQVYQSVQDDEYRTPAASMDPACGDAPRALRATIFDPITGNELDRREVPYACGPEDFFMVAEDGGVMVTATADFFTMPASWNRGDPWPFDGDPADDERGQGEVQPAIAWSVSQADVSASVTSADPGINWDEFEMRFSRGGRAGYNEDASTGAIFGASYKQLWSAGIGGGDTINFCADVAGQLQVTLRHIESNSVAREFVFNNAGAC